ncbi:MAG: trypsin-like serine peptidase [Rubrimonas sp.]|uniref:trypsin-like serine peptidase n=1 Tax=Rubrimonas sp. TaxID=2036015 RepID=UPI002FDD54FA
MAGFAAMLAAVLLFAAPAQADGKRMLEADEAGEWLGVGRLNIAGTRFCTATLIGERIALTAAHCLFHPRTGRAIRAEDIVFVAGTRLGVHAAARRVARTVVPRGYRHADARTPEAMSADVALVEFADPISAEDVTAFEVGPEQPGERWSVVSYARDRAHAPSIEDDCRVVAAMGALRAIDCEATFGASGSPVIARADGARRVVGVISAIARREDQPVSIVVMIAPHIDSLIADLRAPRP